MSIHVLTFNCQNKNNTADKRISTQGYTKYREKVFTLQKAPVCTQNKHKHNFFKQALVPVGTLSQIKTINVTHDIIIEYKPQYV